MAKILFAMAVPHSGMLGQAPEDWLNNGERDRNNPQLWYRNRTWTYPEIEAERGAAFEPFLTIEERTARAKRCRAALGEMATAYARANIDVAIILGKDQKEIFADFSPSIAIYTGEEVVTAPRSGPSTHPAIGLPAPKGRMKGLVTDMGKTTMSKVMHDRGSIRSAGVF